MRQSVNLATKLVTALQACPWIGYARGVLWTGLVALSVLILLYPVRLTLDYHPIQSVIALPNLPLFAGLFSVWFALLLVLLFSAGKKSHWEHVTLLIIFAVTSTGIWILATQGEIRESPLYAAQVDYLKETHEITNVDNFQYFQWPATFLLTGTLSEVTGLSTWTSIVAIQLFWNALFAAFLYLLFFKVTGGRNLAWLGALLVLLGSTLTYKLLLQFHPGTFGMLLFLIAVTLLIPSARPADHTRYRVLLAIVMAATVLTHFVSSVALLLVFAGLALVHLYARQKVTELNMAALSFAFVVAWITYVTVIGFPTGAATGQGLLVEGAAPAPVLEQPVPAAPVGEGLVGNAQSALRDVSSGEVSPKPFFNFLASAYFIRTPAWGSIVIIIWIAAFYFLGTLLALRWMTRLRKLSPVQQVIISMAIGVGALGALSYFVTRGEDTIRLLIYAPFPLVAILLCSIGGLGQRTKAYVVGGLAVLLLVLSFPSFLLNNNTINLNSYNREPEHQAGRFLARSFGTDERVQLFSPTYPWVYHTPFASFRFPSPFSAGFTERQFVEAVKREASLFTTEDIVRGGTSIWVDTKRSILDVHFLLGIDLTESVEWQSTRIILSQANRVYDNGDIELNLRQ